MNAEEIIRKFIKQSDKKEIRLDDCNKVNAMKPEESLWEKIENLRRLDKEATYTISTMRVIFPK